MVQLTGGCACGAVRYELLQPPMWVQCCHCLHCRRETGGPFVINGFIETAYVQVEGDLPVVYAMPTETGRPRHIFRCAKCGVAVWSALGGHQNVRLVRIATLDAAEQIRPNAQIFARTRLPWVDLADDIPAFEASYKRDELWPPQSLARLDTALAAPPQQHPRG